MDIESILKKVEKVFLDLGFKYVTVGEKKYQYLRYKDCYCKITYLEKLKAFVIESADNLKDAINNVLEDGDLYCLNISQDDMLCQLKKDIIAYYME